MAERWETVEQVVAARDRLEAALPGWTPPAALGVGRVRDGRADFVTVNLSGNRLSAVALATVVGHRGGSASYRLEASELARVVGLLAPAEACPALAHPNLVAWRSLSEEADPMVAVFLADLDPGPPGADLHVAQLQARLHEQRPN